MLIICSGCGLSGDKPTDETITNISTDTSEFTDNDSSANSEAEQTEKDMAVATTQPKDFSEQNQILDEQLIKTLKDKNASKLTFFNVQNKLSFNGYEPISNVSKFEPIKPTKEITDSEAIQKFKNELQLDKWQRKRFNVKSMPVAIIYFDDNLHINLETQYNGISWMSINSPQGYIYYTVPNEVYDAVSEYLK